MTELSPTATATRGEAAAHGTVTPLPLMTTYPRVITAI